MLWPQVYSHVMRMLNEYDVMLDCILLKPNMCLPGLDAPIATPEVRKPRHSSRDIVTRGGQKKTFHSEEFVPNAPAVTASMAFGG